MSKHVQNIVHWRTINNNIVLTQEEFKKIP